MIHHYKATFVSSSHSFSFSVHDSAEALPSILIVQCYSPQESFNRIIAMVSCLIVSPAQEEHMGINDCSRLGPLKSVLGKVGFTLLDICVQSFKLFNCPVFLLQKRW